MDPTLITIEKLNDPGAWEHVQYNVPVFVEHELWEVPHPFRDKETVKIAVMPDQPRPKSGKKIYTIGKKELESTCAKINANLQDNGKAVKLFIGHTHLGKQTDQPPLVGYGVEASVGPFGPRNRLAIILKRLNYLKWNDAKDYPERSSEFNPMTGDLTSVALLKTEPKLPMGMVTYQGQFAGVHSRGLVCYESNIGTFFYGGLDNMETMGDNQSKNGPDPTAPPDAQELGPEEKMQAERYMQHYQRTDPVMKYCATQYATMQQAAQAPVQGAPAVAEQNTSLPGTQTPEQKPGKSDEAPAKKGKEDDTKKYEAEATSVHYAALDQKFNTLTAQLGEMTGKLNTLSATNTTITEKYAMAESKRLLTEAISDGVVIKNVPKELEKMVKLDDAGRLAHVNDMRENYAHTDRAPTGPMIGIFDEPATLPGKEDRGSMEEVDQVVSYAEKNKLNLDDEQDYAKCLEAVRKAM